MELAAICLFVLVSVVALTGLLWLIPESLDAKRCRHIRNGHPFDKSERLDKLTSEKHPHSNSEFIYTVNIRKCNDCGLCYLDAGLEFRKS